MHQIVHAIVSRSVKSPDEVRWYVRRVLAHPGKVTQDRVLASGSFLHTPDPKDPFAAVRWALRDALEQLDAASARGVDVADGRD